MSSATQFQWTRFLPAAAIATLFGMHPHASAAAPFDYKLEVTPEEGRLDPIIRGRYTPEWADCQRRARITSEHAECFEAEFRRQDARLNETWRDTLNRLPLAVHKSLLAAQRRWIADRDPFCRNDADSFAGGTIEPIVYSDCRVELTIRRTVWLEALIETSATVESPAIANPSRALKAFLKTYVDEAAVPPDVRFGTRYTVAWMDLNGDGRPEAIVYLMGAEWCGSGGCTMLVLEQSGGGFTIRGRTTVTQAPIAVLPSTNQGWRDLVVEVGGGGGWSGQAVLPFRGERYASNPTVPPARRLGRHEAAKVLIKAEDRGEVL